MPGVQSVNKNYRKKKKTEASVSLGYLALPVQHGQLLKHIIK
jgi:hypothetical protein